MSKRTKREVEGKRSRERKRLSGHERDRSRQRARLRRGRGSERAKKERKDVEEMFSLVSVLLTVKELLCQIQLLPNRFTPDTES